MYLNMREMNDTCYIFIIMFLNGKNMYMCILCLLDCMSWLNNELKYCLKSEKVSKCLLI